MKLGVGTIQIANGRIEVQFGRPSPDSHASHCSYDSATVENVADAARVLSHWMDIPFEDVAMECRRVHASDQFNSELREMIDDASKRANK